MGRSPEAVVADVLARWKREEITLNDFVRTLWANGWTRNMIYNWLEREAEGKV